jgi:hypothetical protein
MKQGIRVIGGILLAAALSSPAWAKHGKGGGGGGGGESMAGGLPALEDRVDAQDLLIATLQGQNNWAQVSSTCTILNSSSSAGAVSATPVVTGECEVTFSKDVSACSSVATIVGVPGEISVAGATKTITGDSVDVFTDVPAGTPANTAFNLTVTCP